MNIILDNGFEITALRNKGLMSAGITTKIEFGSFHEYRNESAHFLEHLIINGKKALPKNKNEYKPPIGGRTSFTNTRYIIEFYKEYFDLIAKRTFNMITNFETDEKKIKAEVGTITNELLRHFNLPYFIFMDNVTDLLFSGAKLKQPKTLIELVKKIDVNKVYSSYGKNYTPDNMKMFVYGDIDEKRALNKLIKMFDGFEGKSKTKKIEIKPKNNKKQKIIIGNNGKTSSIAFAFPLLGEEYYRDNITDYISIDIAFSILINRLFEEHLINRGLAYDTNANIDLYSKFGYLMCSTTIRTDDLKTVENITKDTISDLYDKGIKESEFDSYRRKEFINIALKMDHVESFSEYFMKLRVQDFIKDKFNIEKNIDTVKFRDVEEAVNKYIDPKNYGFMFIKPKC